MKKMKGLKFLFAVVLLAVSGANTAVWGQQSEAANAIERRAFIFIENGDFERAIEEFTQAIRLQPYEGRYFANRAWAYKEISDYTRAIEDFTQAIRLSTNNSLPTKWNLYIQRATAYSSMGNYYRAISDFTQAITELNNDGELYSSSWRHISWCLALRGLAYIRAGDYDSAIDDFLAGWQMSNTPSMLTPRGTVFHGALESLLR